MHKKFLWTLSVLATFLMTTVSAIGVHCFILDEDDLVGYSTQKHNKPMRLSPGTLMWDGRKIDPIRSISHPNLIEYIVANDNEKGLELLRGQRVTLNLVTQYQTSDWEQSDGGAKCLYSVMICIMCPIMLPISLCTLCPEKERTTHRESVGQIGFSTDSQQHTLRLRLDPRDMNTLIISPEEDI